MIKTATHKSILLLLTVTFLFVTGYSFAYQQPKSKVVGKQHQIFKQAGFDRIQNRWKPEQYLHIERGQVESSSVLPGWHSAQWVMQRAGGGYVRFRNRWKSNEYLHVEYGRLQSGPIQPSWWSAMWSLEHVSGTNFKRIKNRWKPNQYMHNEYGQVQAGPVQPGWWSAMWAINSINTPLGGSSHGGSSAGGGSSYGGSSGGGSSGGAVPKHSAPVTNLKWLGSYRVTKNALREFRRVSGNKIRARSNYVIAGKTPQECASICLQGTSFACNSFDYNKRNRACMFHQGNVGANFGLKSKRAFDHYKRIAKGKSFKAPPISTKQRRVN